MQSEHTGQIAPGKSTDRIPDIDILRGFALSGVILVNISGSMFPPRILANIANNFMICRTVALSIPRNSF
jgi:uncharacterized membrane protein YeiB